MACRFRSLWRTGRHSLAAQTRTWRQAQRTGPTKDDPHSLSAVGVKSHCFAQFFGVDSCRASLVFVKVESLEQLTLPGHQVQQSGLVLERAFEFEPDVVQPFAPDLQLGFARSMSLRNRSQQIDQRRHESGAGLVRRCLPSSKPSKRPTICSISRPPARSSSLVPLTRPCRASPAASGPAILRPPTSRQMPCSVCGSMRATSSPYSATLRCCASIIIGSRLTSLSLA